MATEVLIVSLDGDGWGQTESLRPTHAEQRRMVCFDGGPWARNRFGLMELRQYGSGEGRGYFACKAWWGRGIPAEQQR